MGVDLSKIVPRTASSIRALSGKVIALDANNTLYQFLSIIRDYRGQPLRDGEGRVTSHLSGLFYRNMRLLHEGIWLIYVFDGTPPKKKREELERRRRIKEESRTKYEEALAEGRYEEARRHAMATASLKTYMEEDAKRLLKLMGIPAMDAPAEGEAQASYIVRKGDAWASGSQDYDSLLFGSTITVRNITLTGRQRYPSRGVSMKLQPEVIELKRVLSANGISWEQLVDIGILIGTDFNQGVRGIGPVKALKLVKKHGRIEDVPHLMGKVDLAEVEEIRGIFLDPMVTDDYSTDMGDFDGEGIVGFLCGERDFAEERVKKALDQHQGDREGRVLDRWFR
jgi:flap endonuclease-1